MKFTWVLDGDTSILKDAFDIRKKVFIYEQHVDPGIELDGLDQQLIHLIGYIDNRPVATARINLNDAKTKAKIQRVAVIKEHRGQGLGFELMEEIERWAKETNPSIEVLSLSAQDPAIPFYEKLNYRITNEKGYLDANIPHHDMEKQLN
ncbi:GNAT family N-acetyltransferase [Aerococcaceae bacterium INB8]|uniref:GNAT family N-acetyltransferase n=1 Tax=Ruoffia halotolerans TaxID=2748684 RepID=A0A839A760_9LACT|nr:GNAT family N-acetyltransferase [Ruoffia halotolerans]MBA5730089.1 GNAT family N-acetyltransferase [Ruoffia halotolerans]